MKNLAGISLKTENSESELVKDAIATGITLSKVGIIYASYLMGGYYAAIPALLAVSVVKDRYNDPI